jgi:hypothetical protein
VTNVQQPEMRRSEEDPLVQESKGPGPSGRPKAKGGEARPVPAEQVSPYGPSPRPIEEDEDQGRAETREPR